MKPTNRQYAATIFAAIAAASAGTSTRAKKAQKIHPRATKPIPPDLENMNDSRADWAGECVSLMAEMTGCEPGQEALGDLLCNMFHWCDRNGLDMEAMIQRARGCYQEETQGE